MSVIIDHLSNMHLFRSVSRKELVNLVRLCEPKKYQVGQTLFAQDTEAHNAMLLISGKLEVSVRTESSIRHVGEIYPGEIFGEQGLFHSNGKRNATVIANKNSICLTITPKIMRDASSNAAMVALEQHLIATMARRIRSTNLAIQKAWKEIEREAARRKQKEITAQQDVQSDEEQHGLLGRLRSLFGG
jgi:CRP-like cAMP-binding protein